MQSVFELIEDVVGQKKSVAVSAQRMSLSNTRGRKAAKGGRFWSVANHPQQATYYSRIARHSAIHTVCEVGFNAGHSTAIWLTSNANITTVTFDSLALDYSARCKTALQTRFPGRIKFFVGSSKNTVPEAAEIIGKPVCDLLHVDGDHSARGTYTDFYNFVTGGLVQCGTLFLMDDVCDSTRCHCHTKTNEPYLTCTRPTRALEYMKSQNLVTVLDTYFKYEINDRGWVLGQLSCVSDNNNSLPIWPKPYANHLNKIPVKFMKTLSRRPSLI